MGWEGAKEGDHHPKASFWPFPELSWAELCYQSRGVQSQSTQGDAKTRKESGAGTPAFLQPQLGAVTGSFWVFFGCSSGWGSREVLEMGVMLFSSGLRSSQAVPPGERSRSVCETPPGDVCSLLASWALSPLALRCDLTAPDPNTLAGRAAAQARGCSWCEIP